METSLIIVAIENRHSQLTRQMTVATNPLIKQILQTEKETLDKQWKAIADLLSKQK